MKVAVVIPALLGAVSAFSNNAFPTTKRAFAPLPMLPKNTMTTEKVFFPFEDSPSALKERPNAEADDGSAGVRQLLGVKGASAETDIWKIRLQLTKVRIGPRRRRFLSLACAPAPCTYTSTFTACYLDPTCMGSHVRSCSFWELPLDLEPF